MNNRTILMAGVTAIALVAGSSFGFAQTAADVGTPMYPGQHHGAHHATAGIKGEPHPLTVSPAPAPSPVDPIVGLGSGLIGTGTGIVGGTLGGVGTLATAPFAGLGGTAPSISATAAPPLPIKARFAGTGAVSATFDEGFSQDVPVDKSGPIYMIDNTGHDRDVTPFSLLVFPVSAATYAITSPLRPVAHP